MKYNIGIDIGSTCAKTIVLDENKQIIHRLLQPTGWSSVETAGAIREKLTELGVDWEQAAVVATGYGRLSVPYADKCVTEITCHGRGASSYNSINSCCKRIPIFTPSTKPARSWSRHSLQNG